MKRFIMEKAAMVTDDRIGGIPAQEWIYLARHAARRFPLSMREDAEGRFLLEVVEARDRMDTGRTDSKPINYLYKCGRCQAIPRKKEQQYQRRVCFLSDLKEGTVDLPDERVEDPGGLMEEVNLRTRVGEILRRAIEVLPRLYRESVLDFYYDNLSLRECGKRRGITPEAVRLRLERGLVKLRRYLMAKGFLTLLTNFKKAD